MPIQDKALNALQPADGEGKFIGQESGSSDSFPLEIYSFIDQSIRDLDSAEGRFLLRRYLVGAQAEWEETNAKIGSLRTLRSVSDCPDDLLRFLKLTLGWTEDLDHLTDGLEPSVLRRLLSQSIPLWRIRGTEDAYGATIKLIFKAASRVWNWFDLRWVLDANILTEDHQGLDSMLLSLPGPPDMEENRSNLRIVDDGTGTLDRDLAVAFVKLMRPTGERITITWISFLDLFDGDASQWAIAGGGPALEVSGGTATASYGHPQAVYAAAGEAFKVGGQQGYLRLRKPAGAPAVAFGGLFWRQPNGDGFRAAFDIVANTLTLQIVLGGVLSDLAVYDFASDGEMIHEDTWYGLRWLVQTGVGTEIKLYVDGMERIAYSDSPEFYAGSHGFFHDSGSVEVSEIEVMPVPTDSTEIGINT